MNLLLGCIYMAIVLIANFEAVKTNDSPGFFLKVAKNIPRLGRRADREYESFFFKNYKAIPRVGRSNSKEQPNWLETGETAEQRFKRMLSAINTGATEYSVVQPVNTGTLIDLLNNDAIPSDHVKFVHWKDFDRALQLDNELYNKVILLGRRPDRTLKQDLNLGTYVPIFSNSMDGGADFMFYNKDNTDRYDRGYLNYNNLK